MYKFFGKISTEHIGVSQVYQEFLRANIGETYRRTILNFAVRTIFRLFIERKLNYFCQTSIIFLFKKIIISEKKQSSNI